MTKEIFCFSPIQFQINNLNIQLVFPKVNYSTQLYQAINHDREKLAKWLPWAYEIKNTNDEAKFIKHILTLIAKNKIIALTILVNNEPAGMIDLHNLTPNKKAEIGYWLSSKYQGRGIITRSVTALRQYAFDELNVYYIDLIIATNNNKSKNVAKRCNFKLMGIKKNFVNDQDVLFFRKIKSSRLNP